jgi:hypothetical protein
MAHLIAHIIKIKFRKDGYYNNIIVSYFWGFNNLNKEKMKLTDYRAQRILKFTIS